MEAAFEKVVDILFGVAIRQISYMWNYTENINTLKRALRDLKGTRERVQGQIDIAIRRGNNLFEGVEKWMKDADQEISKAEEFVEEEANAKKTCLKLAMCGNWHTLHHYGRRATKMAPSLLQQQVSGTPYESCVSVETLPPTQLDVYQTKNLEDLDTHNSALYAIIATLEDDNIQIIGIYGLGGVGKTTLAKEVVTKVKHLFVDVAFTTVSQTVKAQEIKKDVEIATKRIDKGEKVLIILDDVWEELDLEELCIPCGSKHKNCKILLTSRNEKVCQKMKAQSKIHVNSLSNKEAWILFKSVVGERVETDAGLKPVAEEVVEECGGLPLLIQAVGKALKDESIDSWKAALSQLQKHAPLDIDDGIRKAFTSLQLSYDYLKSKDAKSCFLLCSLFPEDRRISLEVLVRYGVGLEKFYGLESIQDARDRVQNAVNILTSSGLLLNTPRVGWTKMHDVVRDVALLIASQGNNKFLVKAGHGLTEWLPTHNSLERYTGISLMYNRISKLPDYKVHVPHLEIFLVQGNHNLSKISDEFIGCMKNVKVLDILWNDISSLSQSFQLLKKLRTLDLGGNRSLREISILGELKDLEILILNKTGITEIPKEIAQLVNLRVLQVKDCVALSRITKGVIPALSMLEELCIDLSYISKGVNGCIGEVMKLLMLTYLELKVERFDLIPEGFNLENLKGFEVKTSNSGYVRLRRPDRLLSISSKHLMIPLLKWLKKLIVVSRPHISLSQIENLNNVMPTLYDEGFNKLEHIRLYKCFNVSCLVDYGVKRCDGVEGKTEEKFFKDLKHLELLDLYKLEVLWKCPDEYISLTNLVTLRIVRCNKLERLFTESVAQGLINLKKLEIGMCCGLKEVIWGGEDEDRSKNVIVFPSLANISLDRLISLKSFYSGNFSIKYPSLVDVKIDCCKNMKIWGPGIHETPNLKTLVSHYGDKPIVVLDGPFAINEAVEKNQKATG